MRIVGERDECKRKDAKTTGLVFSRTVKGTAQPQAVKIHIVEGHTLYSTKQGNEL